MQAFLGTIMLLAAAFTTATHAQGQQINIFWFEDASCAAWNKSAENKAIRALYDSWVRGFMSGHNYANPSRQVEIGSFPGSEALYQYLDQYCRDNPKSSFVGGAITLVEQLRAPSPAAKKPAPPSAPVKKERSKAAPAAK